VSNTVPQIFSINNEGTIVDVKPLLSQAASDVCREVQFEAFTLPQLFDRLAALLAMYRIVGCVCKATYTID